MLRNLLYVRRILNLNYDIGNEVLSVTFQTGVTHNYSQVPDRVFQKLESSPDKNEFYDENIYGVYPIVVVKEVTTNGKNDVYGYGAGLSRAGHFGNHRFGTHV